MLPANFQLHVTSAPDDRFAASCTYKIGKNEYSRSTDSLRNEEDIIEAALEYTSEAAMRMARAYGLTVRAKLAPVVKQPAKVKRAKR